jgi:glycerol dehydrogenase|tara:strand:- start:250 stop:1356 length:1107 start_codon:yes stop_codon:yes gene_type:complete
MNKTFISPRKYIQGEAALEDLSKIVIKLAKTPLLVCSDAGKKRVQNVLYKSFNDIHMKLFFDGFNGECSENEIKRLMNYAQKHDCDIVIGLGGGKVLDTAKAVAFYKKIPFIAVPTVASNDGPCLALSVIYNENGSFNKYLLLDHNPDIVLVDSGIIAKSPTRLLTAGMGDALSTYFEARACAKSSSPNLSSGLGTNAALELAYLCYKILLKDGLEAKLACDANVVTKAFDNVIEANILLSGLGAESSGIAAAHAVHNGLTVIKECHNYYHGEKVAFGTLVQLVLENSQDDEINEVLNFCNSINLPVCLEDLGVKIINKNEMMKVAELTCAEGETVYNMPFNITVENVYSAIMAADELGKQSKINTIK